jgi:hypothetical protein
MRQRNQSVTTVIEFRRAELIQDVENYAFVAGDIMEVQDEHQKHQVFDVAQDGNDELITRVLNLAHVECLEALYPYTKAPCIHDERLDDILVVPEQYEIGLTLPEDFSRTTVLLLREVIHDYFVCRVLVEWLGITCPSAQPYWKERLETLKSKMKISLLGRRKPLRRGQSMF